MKLEGQVTGVAFVGSVGDPATSGVVLGLLVLIYS